MAPRQDKLDDRFTAIDAQLQALRLKKEDLLNMRQMPVIPASHLGGYTYLIQSGESIFNQLFLAPSELTCAVYLEKLPKDTQASVTITVAGATINTVSWALKEGMNTAKQSLVLIEGDRVSVHVTYTGIEPPSGIWFSARCS